MTKRLSVIIPVYNKKLFVEKCIKTVLSWGGTTMKS